MLILVAAAVVVLTQLTPPPSLALELDRVNLEYRDERDEWFFGVEVFASPDATTASILPPGAGQAIPLDNFIPPTPGEPMFDLSDGPFASLALLQAQYPTGSYRIILNDGALGEDLPNFDPVIPDAPVFATLPINDSRIESDPTMQFCAETACANCQMLQLKVEDVATEGENFETIFLTDVVGDICVSLTDFGVSEIPPDEDPGYEFLPEVFNVTQTGKLHSRGEREDSVFFFVVPEPSVNLLAATALVTAAAVSQFARRGSHSSQRLRT